MSFSLNEMRWISEDVPDVTEWTVISRHTDKRNDPPASQWPYPNEYVTYLVTGSLATNLKKAFGCEDSEAPVVIEETCISGGYSEYTQENDYVFETRCGTYSQSFDSLRQLLQFIGVV